MRKTLTAALAAVTFASGLVAAGAADARPRHHGYYSDNGYYGGRYYDRRDYRRRNDNDAALAAGIVGLALGAAIASGSNSRSRYYDRGYYDRRSSYGPGYYSYGPPAYGYGYAPAYRRSCRTTTFWDPYYGYVDRTRCW